MKTTDTKGWRPISWEVEMAVRRKYGAMPLCKSRLRPGRSGFCQKEVTHVKFKTSVMVRAACTDHAHNSLGAVDEGRMWGVRANRRQSAKASAV